MKRQPSRARIKLAEMLSTDEILVLPEDIFCAKGWWRSSKFSEAYRWEAHGHPRRKSSLVYVFSSWDTLTSCVRYGVIIDPDSSSPCQFDVHSKEKSKS